MTEPGGDPPRDPGAAAERTRLSWRRTSLSAAAVGLLLARPAFTPHARTSAVLAAAAAMIIWVTLVALTYRRHRGLTTRPPLADQRTIIAYAVVTVLLAIVGGFVVIDGLVVTH
ncbi:DUF202 domain-containing protein [Mangrovihabitans endophyticus]|uniref:DUF202 domain-containing protein n=1 Tax=Mangrovihabitans endophyticus TaxID=1751298 RepID=A0A8J3FPW5_9ACTN|nr:DUF202 domain-containing protein [Mangrovihabitans endophyticus]GGK98895.1 hypothetical protein GCM10012284_36500 [Mangrovihabitans endophyticus]